METKKLSKVLTILVIIAICLISFLGIFAKENGVMKNVLPAYNLGMNLKGARIVKLKVCDETVEIIYDSEGNATEDGLNEDGTLKEGYTKVEEPENAPEILTQENYIKVKEIIENRLKGMKISEYTVKVNNNNGQIIIELPENDDTDKIISELTYSGKFEIKDSETKEILIDNKDIKQARCVYGSTDSGTAVYLSIEFNKEGKAKLEEVTRTHTSIVDEDGNTTTKNISIELDGENMLETYFGAPISSGILQLSIGSASTSNEKISEYIEQASNIAALIDSGVMPIGYELEQNNFVGSENYNAILKVIIVAIIVLSTIGFIYWIISYKANGIFASIATIGFLAITLIVIRYTNVVISLEAIVSLITVLVSNYLILQYALKRFENPKVNKNELIKNTYKRYLKFLCPIFIISIVFTFVSWLPIASIGMTMFWSIVILAIYDYIIMKLLFEVGKEK